jgi:hypothetical protein
MKFWSLKHIRLLIFSLIYAFLWAFSDIIHGIDFDNIRDRVYYLDYVNFDLNHLAGNFEYNILLFLANEPLFSFITVVLGGVFETDVAAVRSLIIIISFVGAYYCYHKTRNIYLTLLIMFFGQVYVNYVMSLRQGAALALFLLGMLASGKVRNLFLFCAPFVHSSFFLTLFFYYTAKSIAKYRLDVRVASLFIIILNLIIFNVVLKMASFLGVRQAENYAVYGGGEDTVSGLGFILWGFLLLIFLFGIRYNDELFAEKNSYNEKKFLVYFSIISITFYLFSYIYVPPLARTIQNSALIILTASVYLSSRFLFIFYCLMFLLFSTFLINIINSGILFAYTRN